jgi:hypothetical protein
MRHLAYVSALIFFAGCAGNAPVPTPTSDQTIKTIPTVNQQPSGDAQRAAIEFLNQIKAGQATSDWLTLDFKKIVGEPLTPDERARGFSDSVATEWLLRVGSRLKSISPSPLAGNLFELENGTLRMANIDSKWKVDWFHVGRPVGAASIKGEEAAKRFALASLLDPLFTNDFILTQSIISAPVKATLAPPIGRDDGYNRGTLQSKLKGLNNSSTGYSVTWNGTTAIVLLSNERKLTVVFEPLSTEKWIVKQLEMPQ